ncbi:hypothetical protein KBC85_03130 [Candidatus Saccharibacteria bacterium]|nr:hypothetical protein [Candidatus Saccharibacteria bacterium]
MGGQPNPPPEAQLESIPIVSKELLAKMQEYFDMLINPEPGLNVEDAEAAAGHYFKENIFGRFMREQINLAIFMVRQ